MNNLRTSFQTEAFKFSRADIQIFYLSLYFLLFSFGFGGYVTMNHFSDGLLNLPCLHNLSCNSQSCEHLIDFSDVDTSRPPFQISGKASIKPNTC